MAIALTGKAYGFSRQAILIIESVEGFTLKTLEKIAKAIRMRVKIEFAAVSF